MQSWLATAMDDSRARPQAILFDWDNTLVDNWAAIRAALNQTLIVMGERPWSLDETRGRVRKSLRDSFPQMFGERWEEARDIFYRKFIAEHLDTLRDLPGAEDMLSTFHGEAIYLGVVSNKRGDLLRREAAHLGWEQYFSSLVGAGDAMADKPAPAPVRMALGPGKLSANRSVWLVGDAGIDMKCAYESGCLAVLIGGTNPGTAEFEDCRPHLHARDFAHLARLVRAL